MESFFINLILSQGKKYIYLKYTKTTHIQNDNRKVTKTKNYFTIKIE